MSSAVHALDAPATHRRRNATRAKHEDNNPVEDGENDAVAEMEGEDGEDEFPPTSATDDCIVFVIVAVVLFVMGGLCYFAFTHMAMPGQLLGQRHPNVMRVDDQHAHAHIDLAQLYTGHILQVNVQRQLVCRHCVGSGVDVREGFHECHACHGAGVRTVVQQIGPIKQHVRSPCTVCQGRGKVANKKCDVCHGHGLLRDRKTLDIPIARGMRDGDSVTISHEGDQARGRLPGDVVVHLHMHPHALFIRRGDNLEMELEISLLEALVGFQRNLTHLDNRIVLLRRTEIVSPSTVWLVRGEGMPIRNATAKYGDLLVRFVVNYPTSLTTQEKQRVMELLE